jgi:hypothetical protein
MNPKNWPLLPYIHPSYRKSPCRWLIYHLRGGATQQWDWEYYAQCSGENINDIMRWVNLYYYNWEWVEEQHALAKLYDPRWQPNCLRCGEEIKGSSGCACSWKKPKRGLQLL